jgi:oxygen-independent coproporphyrinogen-3 oxidase
MSPPPPRTPVAYYVHVPFCAQHCSYCDYPVTVGGLQRAGALVTAVLAEVAALRAAVGARPLAALYVGGGTPTFLPAAELQRLLSGLAAALEPHAEAGPGAAEPPEWTLEANPEDLSPELLDVCAETGVNRLSVGVQSFADPLLRQLGRRCTAPAVRSVMGLLSRQWRGRLNIDLLAGIPGQRLADVREDVQRAAGLGIGHITLLQLEHPPPGGLQSSADADELWLAAGDELRRHGYADYEVCHFAHGGDRSRYLCHTLRMQPVAAAGPGAAGTLPAAAAALYGAAVRAPSGAVRCTHTADIGRYLASRGAGWGCAVEPLSATDLLVEHLLQGLRLTEGIAIEPAWLRPPPDALLGELCKRWQRLGLARRSGTRLALTARGRLQLDGLVAEASGYLDQAASRREGLAAAWPDADWPAANGS